MKSLHLATHTKLMIGLSLCAIVLLDVKWLGLHTLGRSDALVDAIYAEHLAPILQISEAHSPDFQKIVDIYQEFPGKAEDGELRVGESGQALGGIHGRINKVQFLQVTIMNLRHEGNAINVLSVLNPDGVSACVQEVNSRALDAQKHCV